VGDLEVKLHELHQKQDTKQNILSLPIRIGKCVLLYLFIQQSRVFI